MKQQPFIDFLDVDAQFAWQILDLAQAVKIQPEKFKNSLNGKILYALYQKTSTRTHLSFFKAARMLGCEYVNQKWDDSNFKIGDIHCESRYIGEVADFLMVRLKEYSDVCKVASAATIPVINGCCNKFHPMQALADAFTLLEYFGSLGDQRFLYIGVKNNMLNSLATLLTSLGVKVVAFVPQVNKDAEDQRVNVLLQSSDLYEEIDELTPERLQAEIKRADVLYLDSWVDMEHFQNLAALETYKRRMDFLKPFSLSQALYGKSDAMIMHCMPVHPGYEISAEMVEHPNSLIYLQAANRTYVQAASLLVASEASVPLRAITP